MDGQGRAREREQFRVSARAKSETLRRTTHDRRCLYCTFFAFLPYCLFWVPFLPCFLCFLDRLNEVFEGAPGPWLSCCIPGSGKVLVSLFVLLVTVSVDIRLRLARIMI
jgi:hypothetical protein